MDSDVPVWPNHFGHVVRSDWSNVRNCRKTESGGGLSETLGQPLGLVEGGPPRDLVPLSVPLHDTVVV